jgi:hypothetical protein
VTAQTPEALASEGAAQLALEVALGPKPYEVVADVLTEAHAIQEAALEALAEAVLRLLERHGRTVVRRRTARFRVG